MQLQSSVKIKSHNNTVEMPWELNSCWKTLRIFTVRKSNPEPRRRINQVLTVHPEGNRKVWTVVERQADPAIHWTILPAWLKRFPKTLNIGASLNAPTGGVFRTLSPQQHRHTSDFTLQITFCSNFQVSVSWFQVKNDCFLRCWEGFNTYSCNGYFKAAKVPPLPLKVSNTS